MLHLEWAIFYRILFQKSFSELKWAALRLIFLSATYFPADVSPAMIYFLSDSVSKDQYEEFWWAQTSDIQANISECHLVPLNAYFK